MGIMNRRTRGCVVPVEPEPNDITDLYLEVCAYDDAFAG